ncbi:hypothetical protein [Thioalkalivibrio sp. ALJ3]|uniref:hypothetical protein n=1 Tax=Thioalkalivibrio sp. ALJ3 TaxID=1240557 RepID=UPI000375DBA5|nr:hypothetical protein [Thioalkalivibrio sp. ALJ3]
MQNGYTATARLGRVLDPDSGPGRRRLSRRPFTAAFGTLLLVLCLAAPAGADEPPGILNILSQFIASSTAASRCAEIDQDQMVAFLANQQTVYLRSTMALQDHRPDWTDEQIANVLKRAQEDIQSQVSAYIDEHGCDDRHARTLTELYAAQAKWRPGQAPPTDTE